MHFLKASLSEGSTLHFSEGSLPIGLSACCLIWLIFILSCECDSNPRCLFRYERIPKDFWVVRQRLEWTIS